MKKFTSIIGLAVSAIAIASMLIFIFTFPVMWLWNTLIPSIFNGPYLTFWQTFGLMIMVRLIIPSTENQKKSENKED